MGVSAHHIKRICGIGIAYARPHTYGHAASVARWDDASQREPCELMTLELTQLLSLIAYSRDQLDFDRRER